MCTYTRFSYFTSKEGKCFKSSWFCNDCWEQILNYMEKKQDDKSIY